MLGASLISSASGLTCSPIHGLPAALNSSTIAQPMPARTSEQAISVCKTWIRGDISTSAAREGGLHHPPELDARVMRDQRKRHQVPQAHHILQRQHMSIGNDADHSALTEGLHPQMRMLQRQHGNDEIDLVAQDFGRHAVHQRGVVVHPDARIPLDETGAIAIGTTR